MISGEKIVFFKKKKCFMFFMFCYCVNFPFFNMFFWLVRGDGCHRVWEAGTFQLLSNFPAEGLDLGMSTNSFSDVLCHLKSRVATPNEK